MAAKKGVLLVNLGTPKSTNVADVRAYLREFLMDERVIDIPYISRWLLVNIIIATFRGPKSAEEYKKVWTPEGSPLLVYGIKLEKLLQEALGDNYKVVLAMRYQSPSLQKGLTELKDKGLEEIIVLPLFPQYASATTGSVAQKIMELIKGWQTIPSLHFIEQFFDHPMFIEAWKKIGQSYLEKGDYEHFVFSYHGLPERQIYKAAVDEYCQLGKCCNTLNSKNSYCYRAQCYATTRLIAQALSISEDQYSVCFQSRLGKDPWIQPYIDNTIDDLRNKGIKKVLAFSPAFVSDCLETTVEIGHEYKKIFLEKGGETWDLVESLNDHPEWIKCLHTLSINACSTSSADIT